jgi:phospholipase/carboxylesterase
MTSTTEIRPHTTSETFHLGASLGTATHALILLHGRGGAGRQIALSFARPLLNTSITSKLCIIAPTAENRIWYPHPYSRDWSQNEPWLAASIERVEREIKQLEEKGISRDKIMVGGFSQGACVAAKYVLSYPARYWGVFIFSGAVPGLFDYVMNNSRRAEMLNGVDLQGTRVFLACGDSERRLMVQAIEWSARVMEQVNGTVDKRIYQGMGHTICDDEMEVLRGWLDEVNVN